MANRLVAGGAEVVLWNRSKGKAADLLAQGAREAECPAEVVESCQTTFAMLADPRASEAVVFGDNGVLAGIPPGHAYVDSSTVDEHTGSRIQSALNGKRARYLCAPVSGGWRDAADGKLLFIAGGDHSVYDEITADGGLLSHMGHKHWYVGDTPVHATRAKLMLQIMMGNMIGALAETMAVTKASGLDPSQIMDMFNNSAMANPICAAKGKLMAAGNYEPNFQVYLQQKDLRLAQSLADQLGVPVPITAAANNQYIRARQIGFSDKDFAAVHEAYMADAPKQ